MMFTQRFQAGYLTAMAVLFTVVALATRSRARRVGGALCSVIVFTALSAPIDGLAARAGFWIYPGCQDPPHPPLAIYLGQALEFVGTIGLLGAPIERRFGARGLAMTYLVTCTLGAVRDFSAAAIFPQMIQFGPKPASILADMAAWAVVVTVGLVVTRVVAGPADREVSEKR